MEQQHIDVLYHMCSIWLRTSVSGNNYTFVIVFCTIKLWLPIQLDQFCKAGPWQLSHYNCLLSFIFHAYVDQQHDLAS